MPNLSLEASLRARGLLVIAGVDEAGRGPLAGPVAAAAVILPPRWRCKGLDDSKKLAPKVRESLYAKITSDERVRWSVAFAEVDEIDRINILRATHQAMIRAVQGLAMEIHHCLIDGLRVPGFPWAHDGVVKGDGISMSIAAASVVAKVSRDRLMCEFSQEFPDYGFESHMGYGTPGHLEALQRHGPCRIHRRSFQPVAQLSLPLDGIQRQRHPAAGSRQAGGEDREGLAACAGGEDSLP
jgi:ribonuclease HII